MAQEYSCPQCGSKLPVNAPGGMCPKCLIKLGMPTGADLEESHVPDPQGVIPTDTRLFDRFVPPEPAQLEEKLQGLEVLELLGQGGMGAVYKARQKQLDRLVALKILPPSVGNDPAFAERFTREARSLARLSHSHIVTIYDFGQTEDNQYYFIMEFVDGTDLRHIMQTGELTTAEALSVVPQICEALQFAHEHGIIHRDIKPENILLDKRGCVKIGDFGLAKLLDKKETAYTLTQTGQKMGTPHYMAPEQIQGAHDVDHRADIYSLGVVFYEMLTGQLPIGRFTLPSQKVQVDVRLDKVVLKSLENEPDRRYQHASEVKSEIECIDPNMKAKDVGITSVADDSLDRNTSKDNQEIDAINITMQRLRIPTVGLFIAGIFSCLIAMFQLILLFLGSLPIMQIVFLGIILGSGLIIIAGAWAMNKLQSYALAVVGSIVAMFSVSFLLGLPMGVWALIVLSSPNVQEAFTLRRNQDPSKTKHKNRPKILAFTGLAVVLLALITPVVIMLLLYFKTDRFYDRPKPTITVSRQNGEGGEPDVDRIGNLDFPRGTRSYVEIGSKGPVITELGIQTLDLKPSEVLAVNDSLQTAYREYFELEAKHTTKKRIGDHLEIAITPFRAEALRILRQFWAGIDSVLDTRKQAIARRHLPLSQLFGMFHFGEPTVNVTIDKQGGGFNYELTYIWPKGSSQEGGGTQGRTMRLAAEYQRFWDESATD